MANWKPSDVEDQVSKSTYGAKLVDNYKSADYKKLEATTARKDENLKNAAGYHDAEGKRIVLDQKTDINTAINTLAHEAEHARQATSGERPDPKTTTKSEYIEAVKANEAKAETSANQVAYDLNKQGISQPLNEQKSKGNAFCDQAREYSKSRDAGKSHEEAAEESESLAMNDPNTKKHYEDLASKQWENKNPNAKQFPEQGKDKSSSQDEGNSWKARMQAKQEASQIKKVEPPPEPAPSQGLSK